MESHGVRRVREARKAVVVGVEGELEGVERAVGELWARMNRPQVGLEVEEEELGDAARYEDDQEEQMSTTAAPEPMDEEEVWEMITPEDAQHPMAVAPTVTSLTPDASMDLGEDEDVLLSPLLDSTSVSSDFDAMNIDALGPGPEERLAGPTAPPVTTSVTV